MLVFHLCIYRMNISRIRNRNAIGILVDYIPTAFFTVRWDMAIFYVLKNTLMKISNIIVAGLIPLPKNFVADNFIPS